MTPTESQIDPTNPRRVRVKVYRVTPSLNAFAYAHWTAIAQLKKFWARTLWLAVKRVGFPDASGKRRVTIERCGKRRLDADNLVGGLKPVIDGMKTAHILTDDDDDGLDLIAIDCAENKIKNPHTIFTIEDL